MRKFIVTFLVIFISLSLYPEGEGNKTEGSKKVDFGLDFYAYGAGYKTVNKGGSLTFAAYEFFPFVTFEIGNVKSMLQLGIDQFLGDGSDENYAPIGSDKKAVKVEKAYVDIKIPFIKGFSVKAGIDDYNDAGSLIISDYSPMFRLNYLFSENSVSLAYVKIEEGLESLKADDAQILGLDANLKLGSLTFSSSLFIISGGKGILNTPWSDSTALVPSFLLSIELGDLLLDFSFAYGSGKDKVNSVKYSGYAFDFYGSYKKEGVSVGIFTAAVSGDKYSTSNKFEGFSAFRISGVKGTLLLLENKQKFSTIANDNFADIRYLPYGYILLGGSFESKFDIFEVMLNAGYGQLMKQVSGSKNNKNLGFEIDFSFAVNIDNAKILLETAYLNTGGAFGDKGFGLGEIQNAMYAGLGVVVNF